MFADTQTSHSLLLVFNKLVGAMFNIGRMRFSLINGRYLCDALHTHFLIVHNFTYFVFDVDDDFITKLFVF